LYPKFSYLSFVTIIRKTDCLCCKLKAILYHVQFTHFCSHTDMITAYKVLIYINSCYTANKALTSYTKCYSFPFVTFCLRLKRKATTRNLTFNVHGSVHRKYIPMYIQQDATLHSLFYVENCSTCFGWYFHPSSGAHTNALPR
jgi:hypothetical protein